MITLDDLRFLEDGGEFDMIRRNAEVKSGGDEKMKFEEMELSIIPAFVQRVQKEAKERDLRKLREEERLTEEHFRQLWQELFEEAALQKIEEEVDLQRIIRGVDEQKWKALRKRRTLYGMPRSTAWSVVPASSCGHRSGSDDKTKKKKKKKRKRDDDKDGDFQLQGSEKNCVLSKKKPKKVSFSLNVNKGDNNTVGCNEDPSFSSTAILPEEFQSKIREMGGEDTMFVLQKKITKSDTDKQQNRLSIPPSQIKAMFLTQQELDETLDNNGKIETTLIEPCLETTSLTFKKWPMNSTSLYVLNGPWCKNVVSNQRNGIAKDVHVQLWAFRVSGKLCLVLVNEQIN